MKPATKNIVLGAGHIYFDEAVDGQLTGERYLAETPGFSLTVSSESLEDFSSDGPTAEKHLDVATRVSRDAALTLKDMSSENFAMFIMGDVSKKTTTSGAVTAAAVNDGNGVLKGRWYQLGVSPTMPTGVRKISLVAIKSNGGSPTTYVKDTDYELDVDLGRIYIIPGGSIADGTVITSDFTRSAAEWEQVTSNDLGPKSGALRFVASNTSGANKDLYLPSIVLKPDGEFAFKSRDTVQQMGFAVAINSPGDGRASVYLNGRAV